jgi:hypothetical protein
MVAVAWTAIGLLAATLLGSLYCLGTRIDGLSARIDQLGARRDGRIDSLSSRIDALGARLHARMDALTDRIDAHVERHAG